MSEKTKVVVTFDEKDIMRIDRAVQILQAHGETNVTREELIETGALNFINGFLMYFDELINIFITPEQLN